MRIRMKETRPGSEDGVVVTSYQAGRVYDVGEELGRVFVAEGWAEEVKARRGRANKARKAAPENKAGSGRRRW